VLNNQNWRQGTIGEPYLTTLARRDLSESGGYFEAKKNLRIRVGWCKIIGFNIIDYADDSPINTSGISNLSVVGDPSPATNRNITPQSVTIGENQRHFTT
jgi:hypothetical protein